jgi:hypothetical protein
MQEKVHVWSTINVTFSSKIFYKLVLKIFYQLEETIVVGGTFCSYNTKTFTLNALKLEKENARLKKKSDHCHLAMKRKKKTTTTTTNKQKKIN